MLNDVTCFQSVCIVTGHTVLRSGMDRLTVLVESQMGGSSCVPTPYIYYTEDE